MSACMDCGECPTCIKADVVQRLRVGVPLTAASEALRIIAREAASLGLVHDALKTADDVASLWRRIEARRRESRVAEAHRSYALARVSARATSCRWCRRPMADGERWYDHGTMCACAECAGLCFGTDTAACRARREVG